ncbi:ribonuclease H family protein [Bdellovibrio reynosensis]|uniref:ribonuclease H n=1 Tax=Bdellovibrio reynosensis TaxID=2835041 RepID=A0ABY4C987_9BACT|nr:ribonuclease H [Bdellovibrio reynosensis]UOF01551.1 ribonuclease HI [Bdellovibrio reynosensis]
MISFFRRFFVKKKTSYQIYTDGSLKKNKGTWAFLILQNDKILCEMSGKETNTTSLRMELTAAIKALKQVPAASEITLYSDSRILINTASKDMFQWQKNNWLKTKERKIPDIDLVKELHNLTADHNIEWKWVKAHSGNPLNERCDELCRLAQN